MSRKQPILAAVLLATVGLVGLAAPAFAHDDCERVDVNVEHDSCGGVLAVSATGDAQGHDCGDAHVCLTASATGNATNKGGAEACNAGCVAVSATGNASNRVGPRSCGNTFAGAAFGCVAVSGTGDAVNAPGGASCGWSGFAGVGVGCVAVSGTGDARTETGPDEGSCGANGRGNVLYAPAAGCLEAEGPGGATDEARVQACVNGICPGVSTGQLLGAHLPLG